MSLKRTFTTSPFLVAVETGITSSPFVNSLTLQRRTKDQTCKEGLQLLALVGNDVVGRGDKGAAGTVDAQLQAQVILCPARTKWSDQLIEVRFTSNGATGSSDLRLTPSP